MDRSRIELELVGPLRTDEMRRVMRRNELAARVPRQTWGRAVAPWLRRNSLGACRRLLVVDRNRFDVDEWFRRPVGSLEQTFVSPSRPHDWRIGGKRIAFRPARRKTVTCGLGNAQI